MIPVTSLSFLALMIGGALTLFAWRAPKLGSSAGFEIVSRESFLLFNNILLVVAAAVVFGGTLAANTGADVVQRRDEGGLDAHGLQRRVEADSRLDVLERDEDFHPGVDGGETSEN